MIHKFQEKQSYQVRQIFFKISQHKVTIHNQEKEAPNFAVQYPHCCYFKPYNTPIPCLARISLTRVFKKHSQTPNYLHCRYFKTTIIQTFLAMQATKYWFRDDVLQKILPQSGASQLRGDMRKFSVKLRRVKLEGATVAPVKVDFAAKSRNLSFLMVDGHSVDASAWHFIRVYPHRKWVKIWCG